MLANTAVNEERISGTAKGLVVGSGLELFERGAYDVKEVPGQWGLVSVEARGKLAYIASTRARDKDA